MQISVSDLDNQMKEISVEVGWEDIVDDYRELLREYAKMKVPGFRPGTAPKEIVEARFQNRILDDMATRCIRRFSNRALEESEMTATGPVSVKDIEIVRDRPLRFKALFVVVPDFELPDYTEFRFEAQTDAQKRDEVSRWLLDNTKVDVQDTLVEQEISLDGGKDIKPGGGIWQAAFERVKLLLILKKIAVQDGIEVDERDVNKRIEATAESYGTPVSSLRQKLLSSGGMSRIRSLLLAERTLDYLLEIGGR
jgi:FKBP-type peptidyl-prolyl cis-trans isomerase (trigger factor)